MSLAQELSKLIRQKAKLWIKTGSQQALEQNIFDFADLTDLMTPEYTYVVFDSVFTSLITALWFDIPLTDIQVLNQCYETSVPSTDEFMKGKLIDIKPCACLEKYPEIGEWLKDIRSAIKSHFGKTAEESRPRKGVYGLSKYGQSFYDPQVIRDFIRSTQIREVKKWVTPETAAASLKSFILSLDLNPSVVNTWFTISNTVSALIRDSALVDMAIVGVSKVSPGIDSTVVESVDLNLSESVFEIRGYNDIAFNCFVGSAVVGWSFVCSDKYSPPEEMYETPGLEGTFSKIAAIAQVIAREQVNRLYMTPLMLANYQTHDERTDFSRSQRIALYGSARAIYYNVRAIVNNLLKGYPELEVNMYNVAVQQLLGRVGGVHRWGEEVYREIDALTLRNQWVEEWAGKGLDRAVLEKIFDSIVYYVKAYNSIRVTEKLRLMARWR